MTDNNYSHILAIVDRSASMSSSAKTMTSALNEFFQGQAEVEGKCLVDYVQFDSEYELVYKDRPVEEAEAFINPRASTALIDAIGRGTTELGIKLKKMKEVHRPGKVLVVVVTDGHENSSREWTAQTVRELVTKQQDKYDWDYVFLGANIDAVATGGLYGFKADKAMDFNIHNGEAIIATSSALSSYATNYRSGGPATFTDEDRKKANANS